MGRVNAKELRSSSAGMVTGAEPEARHFTSPKRHFQLRAGRWLSVVSVVCYFSAWVAASSDGFHLVGNFKFPSPSTVYTTATSISLSVVGRDMLVTFERLIEGLTLGTVLGVLLGLAMAYSRVILFILDPIVESWRPVPAIAFTPFLLLWFGLAETGKIALVVMGVSMLMVVNTFEAAKNVPRIYVNAARSLGASRMTVFRTVVLPRIVPDLIGPFRVALALSFTLVVAAEFMGSQSGLGFLILNAQRQLETGTLFLGVMLFGVMANILDNLTRAVGAYLTRWSERSTNDLSGGGMAHIR